MNATVTGPCGHTTDLDLSCQARDHYACASCGLQWHIIQDPPTRHPSGWIAPGKRALVMGPPPVVSHSRKRRGREGGGMIRPLNRTFQILMLFPTELSDTDAFPNGTFGY